jgi:hypothetical protein
LVNNAAQNAIEGSKKDSRPLSVRAWKSFVPVLGLLIVAGAMLAARPRKVPRAPVDQIHDVTEYAGSSACVACHRNESRDFGDTPHARALARADTAGGAGLLDEILRPESETLGDISNRILFQKKGARLWAQSGSESLPVDWYFGSGAFGMTFVTLLEDPLGRSRLLEHHWSWFRDGDTLAVTPGHTPGDAAAGLARFGDVMDPTATRACFSCHATAFLYDSGRLDPSSVVVGIQCERCHGPRRDHIAAKMQTLHSSMPAPRPRPSARQQVYTCGECHRRPDEINDEIRPDNPVIARFPSVGLVQSKCFTATEAEGTLTCTTCHDPHRAGRPTAGFFDARCNDCHSLTRNPSAVICSASPGDRSCVGCHMPKVRLHEHLEFTDHWIRSGP